MSRTDSTTVLTDASAPGSLPFVDMRPSDFGDTWRQLSERQVSMVDRVRPLAELVRSGSDL